MANNIRNKTTEKTSVICKYISRLFSSTYYVGTIKGANCALVYFSLLKTYVMESHVKRGTFLCPHKSFRIANTTLQYST